MFYIRNDRYEIYVGYRVFNIIDCRTSDLTVEDLELPFTLYSTWSIASNYLENYFSEAKSTVSSYCYADTY